MTNRTVFRISVFHDGVGNGEFEFEEVLQENISINQNDFFVRSTDGISVVSECIDG